MFNSSENSKSSANHSTAGVVADTTLTANSFALMKRAGHEVPLLIEPTASFQVTGSRHSNSTPPPDDIPVTQAQLVSGAGGLFPSLPPSRASSLTMGSEPPTTPVRGSYADNSPPHTIRFGENDDCSTPVAQRHHTSDNSELLIPPRIPWTPPSSTQRYNSRKRQTFSSPPSPRPSKLARLQHWDGHQQVVSRRLEDEGYCDEESQAQQTAAAFRNAQGLAFVLASNATNSEFQPTVASSSGRFHVFGGSLVPTEDDDPESTISTSLILDDSKSHENNSIAGTSSSVHCHYGQDELMVTVEWFTEDEIEAQLSELLASYRAVYLASLSDEDTDEMGENKQQMTTSPTTNSQDIYPEDKDKADSALEIFKMMAHGRLNWAELDMVLQEEEEDILNLFMTWVQDMNLPKEVQSRTFLDTRECLGYLKRLTVPPTMSSSKEQEIKALPFVRKIRLWSNGCLDRFLDGLPGLRGVNASSLSLDGAVEWEFEHIYRGLGEKEVAELVTAWDDLMIRDE